MKNKNYVKKVLTIIFVIFTIYIINSLEIRVPKISNNALNISLESEFFLNQQCKNGIFIYCYELGSSYYFAEKTSTNQKKAKKYLEKSCDNQIENSCYLLGIMHQNKSFSKSKYYFERACLGGYGFACYQLGNNSITESALFNDKKYTKKMYKEACLNGFLPGCFQYVINIF